jgi:hypothetical protein
MYKTEEGLLYGLQVTRQKATKEIKTTAVDNWLTIVGLKDHKEKVRIAVIPKPNLAEEFNANSGYPQLEVWKVPLDYCQQF